MKNAPCPVCSDSNGQNYGCGGDFYAFGCPRCGRFALHFSLHNNGKINVEDDVRFKVQCLFAERALRGLPAVLLALRPFQTASTYVGFHLEEFLEGFPKRPSEYFDRTLLNLSFIVKPPVGSFPLTPQLFSLCFTRDPAECQMVLKELTNQGYLSWVGDAGSNWCITGKGWERIERLNAPGRDSRQAFVAMWFDPSRQTYFDEGFKLAIEHDKKFDAFRVDQKEHNQKIDDEIVAEIRRSRYLVADFTGNRGSVYFEAGFALGLGLPVIWCVQQGEEKDLHFDTRQYNHITYSDAADLKTKLLNRIRATIG